MCLTVTEEGVFASQDVRYKESSTSSVFSGFSYQGHVDSLEDKDSDTQDGVSTVESSDQEDEKISGQEVEELPGSVERKLSDLSMRSSASVETSDPRGSGASDLSSLRRSIGRGNLLERLRRSSSVRPGSVI